jgi:hypothetical protein
MYVTWAHVGLFRTQKHKSAHMCIVITHMPRVNFLEGGPPKNLGVVRKYSPTVTIEQ